MGCYVNPKNETKEAWLEKNATVIYKTGTFPSWGVIFSSKELPVILIDNGTFTAAGIAYDEREYADFTDPNDPRPRQIYKVPIDKLKEVSDILNYLK